MAEHISLGPEYNKPAQTIDDVAQGSILETLSSLCTGPEFLGNTRDDIVGALRLLITYPQEENVVRAHDLKIISTSNIGIGQAQIETSAICSVTYAPDWIQILLLQDKREIIC